MCQQSKHLRCIIGTDNTFIASHFSNNQTILSKAPTASIEEVFHACPMLRANVVQHRHALRRLWSWRQVGNVCSDIIHIDRLDPDLSSGYLLWNILHWHYSTGYLSVIFFATPCIGCSPIPSPKNTHTHTPKVTSLRSSTNTSVISCVI